MIISYGNREALRSLSFSDSIFEGFSYKYDVDMLTFSCLNQYDKKRFFFSFYQTILFNMQSCNLWGSGNSIYDICYLDSASVIKQLQQIKSNNQGNIDKSKLDTMADYLCISVCLNSGDELVIVCESVEILCDDIT
jgi:hypothetical protein